MNWYLKSLKKCVAFNGRARRKEYWEFLFVSTLLLTLVLIIDIMIGTSGLLYSLYGLIILIPCLAASVRRLHDIGKSGWTLLILLVPVIGEIWLLMLMLTEGDMKKNEYGLNPKIEEIYR